MKREAIELQECKLCDWLFGSTSSSAYAGVCRRCADEVNVDEAIRRVERWVELHGRQRIAEVVLVQADEAVASHEGEGIHEHHRELMRIAHRRWLAFWEFANDGMALRRIVQRRLVKRGVDVIPVPNPDLGESL